mgnify:CR=1 FL=1
MADYPKLYKGAENLPASALFLVDALLPGLLEGEDPDLRVLRDQYRVATAESVEWTGHGFFLTFVLPVNATLTKRSSLAGGGARIELDGNPDAAGCVLFVNDHRLDCLECYRFVEHWDESDRVTGVRDIDRLIKNDETERENADATGSA